MQIMNFFDKNKYFDIIIIVSNVIKTNFSITIPFFIQLIVDFFMTIQYFFSTIVHFSAMTVYYHIDNS